MSKLQYGSVGRLALAMACVASATNALAAGETIPMRKIVRIQTYAKGAAIHYSPPYTNAQGCAGSLANNAVFVDLGTAPELKTALATALAAYMAGKQVGFGIEGCYAGYGSGVPSVYRIDIED